MSGTPRSSVPAHIVLVPGFWLGAWAWDEVVSHLRGQGLAPLALTPPLADGYAADPEFAASEHPLSAQYEEELAEGSMAGLSEEQLARFRDRAVPQPATSLRDAVSLVDDRRLDVPGTFVCTAYPATDYRSYAEQGVPFLAGVLEYRRLELVDLPTGHWPMWSRPAELAGIIARAAGGQG